MKSLTKEHHTKVLHPHLQINECVEPQMERGLAEGSAYSPRLYSIFLSSLLRKLKAQLPGTMCAGRQSLQWIGALAYVEDLCLCADSISELETMISCAQEWADDHRAKMNYDKDTSEVMIRLMIALIIFNSNVVSLLEGLCSSNPCRYLSPCFFEFLPELNQ
jgi:hypothetical protein